MAAADNRYSRLVQLGRVVLPLAALGLFSTLFLFARDIDPTRAVSLAEVDVEQLAREARVGRPVYAGVTADGTAVLLRAERARPEAGDPARMTAEAVEGTFESPSGTVARVAAAGALFDSPAQRAELDREVRVQTADGWQLRSDRLEIDLPAGLLVSPGPVVADGPLGRLQAGAMRIDRSGRAGRETVDFAGGVRLLYDPR